MTERGERVSEELKNAAAVYFSREANRTSMITITNARISNDFKRMTVYFTVFPEEQEEAALAFARRKRSDFRNTIKKTMNLKRIPFFEFAIDEGEKNRQRIDSLDES